MIGQLNPEKKTETHARTSMVMLLILLFHWIQCVSTLQPDISTRSLYDIPPSASPTSLPFPSPLPSATPTALPSMVPSFFSVPSSTPTQQRPDPSKAALSQSLTYLTMVSHQHGIGTANDNLFSDAIIADASECDDTPMTHVPLSFPFNYGGVRFRHLFLNPNGMLFFDTTPPCMAYFSAGPACDFDSVPWSLYGAYYNLIAVFGSDFNPADFEDSVVEYVVTEQKVLVRWQKLALYGSQWQQFQFSAELRTSGHIRIHFDSVRAPEDVTDAPNWVIQEGALSALRFGAEQLNRTVITYEQKEARDSWLDGSGSSGDGVDGVYLDRDAVIGNDTTVDYCPIPVRYCLSPTQSYGIANVTLSTEGLWGCDDDVFGFRCSFTTDSSVTYSDVLVVNEEEAGNFMLKCLAPQTVGVFAVGLVYQFKDNENDNGYSVSNDDWSEVSDIRIPDLTVVASVSDLFGDVDDSSDICDGTGGSCDVCGVCEGADACIGCDDENVYAESDCSGYCDGNNGLYGQDYRSVCCERINGSDCLGICGGIYEPGLVSSGAYKVCCYNVDCAGYCSGRASLDTCGVCSGGNSGHTANSDVDSCGICFGNTTCAPTPLPSGPSSLPTLRPSFAPTNHPTITPQPSLVPSSGPTMVPVPNPSPVPTLQPTEIPTMVPIPVPSFLPSALPSSTPTPLPSALPTPSPSSLPSPLPTPLPSPQPSVSPLPTPGPSITYSPTRTHQPTISPTFTVRPSSLPTSAPTRIPSSAPTELPSLSPTNHPTPLPTYVPSLPPTLPPSSVPTFVPTSMPSQPTVPPTPSPTSFPSKSASKSPTRVPTPEPSGKPTKTPTHAPSKLRSQSPTSRPTHSPTYSPLKVAYISSAVVLDGVSYAQWTKDQSGATSVFSTALSSAVSLILSSDLVKEVNASVISYRRRLSIGRELSETGVLVRFSAEVFEDESNPLIMNASIAFKNTISELSSAVSDGSFSSAISLAAGSGTVLSSAGIVISASQQAIQDYSRYVEISYNRHPTALPSPPPSHPLNDDDNGGPNTGSANPLLITVIILEIVVSAALCVCCFKVRRNNTDDPFDQQALTQNGNILRIDPSLFGRSSNFERQYRNVMESIPATQYFKEEDQPLTDSQTLSTSSSTDENKDNGNENNENIEATNTGQRRSRYPPGVFVEDSCSICLCDFDQFHSHNESLSLSLMNAHLTNGGDETGIVKVLNCGHCFHPSCLDEWLSRRNVCPLCKRVPIINLNSKINNLENPLSVVLNQNNQNTRTSWWKPKKSKLTLNTHWNPRLRHQQNGEGNRVSSAQDGRMLEMRSMSAAPSRNNLSRMGSSLDSVISEGGVNESEDTDFESISSVSDSSEERPSLPRGGGGGGGGHDDSLFIESHQIRSFRRGLTNTLLEMGFGQDASITAGARFSDLDAAVAYCLARRAVDHEGVPPPPSSSLGRRSLAQRSRNPRRSFPNVSAASSAYTSTTRLCQDDNDDGNESGDGNDDDDSNDDGNDDDDKSALSDAEDEVRGNTVQVGGGGRGGEERIPLVPRDVPSTTESENAPSHAQSILHEATL